MTPAGSLPLAVSIGVTPPVVVTVNVKYVPVVADTADGLVNAQPAPHTDGAVYANTAAGTAALVPPTVVTATVTASTASPTGAVASIWESLTTVKGAYWPPNDTPLAPVNPDPVTTTCVPPVSGPLLGLSAVTAGATTNVNWSRGIVASVPPGPVTVTSTVPAGTAGETAVIEVSATTEKLAAGVAPKLTCVAPVNPVPVIVTAVPPDEGPLCDGDPGEPRRRHVPGCQQQQGAWYPSRRPGCLRGRSPSTRGPPLPTLAPCRSRPSR